MDTTELLLKVQRVLFLYILADTYFIVLLVIAILTGVRWYIIVVLICISLIINGIGHLYAFFGKIPIFLRL